MPWSCGACGALVEDDGEGTCAACGARKTSWTVIQDRTRTLRLGKRRFELLRGTTREAAPPRDPPYAGEDLLQADHGVVVAASTLRALHAQGLAPAGHHVLFVRLRPDRAKDWTVRVAIDLAQDARREEAHPVAGELVDGEVDARFVFVCADGADLAGVTFPGVALVDVTDDAGLGYAPEVEVRALGRAPRELPLRPAGEPVRVQLLDERGAPLARAALSLGGAAFETDDDGRFEALLPGGQGALALASGRRLTLAAAAPAASDELEGVRQRLLLLGYAPGHLDPPAGPGIPDVPYRLRRAIQAFQADRGLGVDGIPGPKTQGALVEALGR